MLKLYKFFKYLFLLSIAGVFLYLSLYPDEYEKYNKKASSYLNSNNLVIYLKQIHFLKLSQAEIEAINNKSIFINFPQKSVEFKLIDIGITFNENKEMLIDQNKFEKFNLKVNEEVNYLRNYPNINLENNEFYELGNNSKIKLDDEDFLKKVTFNQVSIYNNLRIIPKFSEDFIPDENSQANTNLRKKLISNPLSIKAGRMVLPLTSKNIDDFIDVTYQNKKEVLKINTQKIESFLEDLNNKNKFPTEVDYKASATKLSNFLLFRLTEENPAKTFILPISGGYSMSPMKHNKFVEVSKSQQRAYLFDGGQLKKTLYISTGITWETPAGEFKVLNKVPMTISYTNSWYMPWYMPLGTINGKYYFGFHEVPYHMDYNGMIYSRDPETIGSPATGGCIQVLKGQAKDLFDWAEVGMPVYITE